MPAGHGLRSRTRDSFSRPFRGKGAIPLSVYLRTFRLGDYVDIKVNSDVHKVRGGGREVVGRRLRDSPRRPILFLPLLPRACRTNSTTAAPASCGT